MAVILVARFKAKDAAAAEKVQKHLSDIRDHALSDKEPGTLMYYPTRGNDDDPLKFCVFEEYESQDAVKAHMAYPVFTAFGGQAEELLEGGRAALDIAFYHRF